MKDLHILGGRGDTYETAISIKGVYDNATGVRVKHFHKGHVRGALSFPALEIEERFPGIETLLPKDERIVLYCAGPECGMAEKVATFLLQRKYKNLYIMNAGFGSWQRAGHPVEGHVQ